MFISIKLLLSLVVFNIPQLLIQFAVRSNSSNGIGAGSTTTILLAFKSDACSVPISIDFSAAVVNKKPYKNNFVQYPYHNLKQNRTYQVGFVLSDRYGRQSDVVLSSYDNL